MSQKQKQKAMHLNNLEQQFLWFKIKKLCMSLYKWKHLPPSMESEYFEKYLFEYGYCAMVYDNQFGDLVLPCTGYGGLNFNEEYTKYHVRYTTIGDKDYTVGNNFVLVKNNSLKTSTKIIAEYYKNKLFNISRGIDINISNNKTPYLIRIDPKEKFSIERLFDNIDEFEEKIYTTKNVNTSNFQILDLKVPFIAQELKELYRSTWNDFLTDIGINNFQENKKERLIQNEVNANNQERYFNIKEGLRFRRKAAKEFNKMRGTNIKVVVNVKEISEQLGLKSEQLGLKSEQIMQKGGNADGD